MKTWITALAFVGCVALDLRAAPCNIENASLAVTYDDAANSFSVRAKAERKPFLLDGKFDCDAGKASIDSIVDPVFGSGQKIVVTQVDGSDVSLELYGRLPFVLIRKEAHNGSTTMLDLQKIVPAAFTLDLDKPASELRTMGTAGLTAPDGHSGSYLFLTLADPATRRGVVAGWLTEDRGSGVIFSSVKSLSENSYATPHEGTRPTENGQNSNLLQARSPDRAGFQTGVKAEKVQFKTQIDYGHLLIPPGKSEKLETLAIGLFDDARLGEEAYADAIKEQYRIKLRPQMSGYCTWYSEVGGMTDKTGGAGCSNEKNIAALARFGAGELKPYGFSFVQIDDGWQDGKLFNGPKRGFTRAAPNGPYSHGMEPVAEMIKSNGLIAGLWFMPFARNHQDPEYKDRQSWFMKRLDGTPYETAWGGTSLDLTNPEVQEHLVALAKSIHGWGYDYFKMDGLWTGSVTKPLYVNDGYKDDEIGKHQPFHDPMKTSIEALRDGLKLLRQGAGPDVFFSGCCASQNMRSLGGSIGLVDSMRIGPDNGFDWQDYRNEVMHFEGGAIITGPIRGNHLYFLNGRVWWNDPDPSYVRSTVKLNHAQLLASWVAISGMFNLNSDWLPALPPERLDILKRCTPSHHAASRPVDYFETVMPRIWLLTDTNQSVRRDVLGLYNWDSEERNIRYDAAKAGLSGDKTYYAFDFWSKSPLPAFTGAFNFAMPPESCRVIAVRTDENHPLLVSTSRHVTQGVVDVTDETWDDLSETLTGLSQVVGNDPYELRVAGLAGRDKQWRFISASVPASAMAEGVTIAPQPAIAGEEGWVRVLITSKSSRPVGWSLKFAREYSIVKTSMNHLIP